MTAIHDVPPSMSTQVPQKFRLPRIGADVEGYLTIATMDSTIPFVAQRVFWICGTPPHLERGGHANRTTRQVLVGITGRVEVSTETLDGRKDLFVLDDPGSALYLPAMCWRTIRFSEGAVLLVMASTLYTEADYIRNLMEFHKNRHP